jgi:hypothetical protein
MIAQLVSDLWMEARLALHCWARPSLMGIVCVIGAALMVAGLMMSVGLSGAMLAAAMELSGPMLGALLLLALLGPVVRCGSAQLRLWPRTVMVIGRIAVSVTLAVAVARLLVAPLMLLGSLEGFGPAVPAAAVSTFYVVSVCAAVLCLTKSRAGAIGTAVTLCGLDLLLGFSGNPLLSLQGAAAIGAGAPFQQFWLTGKITLGALGLLAALISVWAAGRPPTFRRRRLAWAIPAVAAVAFVGIGAGFTLAYLHANRDQVTPDLSTALAEWSARYQPLPVRALLTPAGRALADPALQLGPTQGLSSFLMERLAFHRPTDPWSDALAMASAQRRASLQPDSDVTLYTAVADHFPRSLFAPRALEKAVRRSDALDEDRLVPARRILRDYPSSPSARAIAVTFGENYPQTVTTKDLKTASLLVARHAHGANAVRWLVVAAGAAMEEGGVDEARGLVAEARKRIQSGEVPTNVRLGVERQVNAVAEQVE